MKWVARRNALLGAVLAIMLFLGGRLFYMQVIRSEEYRRIATDNRIRVLPLLARRGEVFDRNGIRLVRNRLSFEISVLPSDFRGREPRARLARVLDMDSTALSEVISRHKGLPLEPVSVSRDVDFRTICRLQERLDEFSGVMVGSGDVREYPTSGWAGHVLGYVRDVSRQDRSRVDRAGNRLRGVVGAVGLEKEYDDVLRGVDGTRYVQMNALGQIVGSMPGFTDVPATNGDDVWLTIDARLQALADSLLAPYRAGTVVALDVHTGGVLCFVTRPGYDPNMFSGPLSVDEWKALKNDPRHPLLNRATRGQYSPGSTTKLAVAAVALEKGLIGPGDRFPVPCRGGYRFGNRIFKCWKAAGHGFLNLIQAIEQSCNVYFYQLAQKIDLDEWAAAMRADGFGRTTGIDLAGESNGLVPDRAYYDERYGRGRWSRGVMLNLAIGQGEFLVTPLQLVRFYAAIANDGTAMRPHFLLATRGPAEARKFFQPEVDFQLPDSPATLRIVREAARLVVHGDHGTARGIDDPDVRMAGKTGTAQNPHGKEHAWFAGYAPAESPRIAVVALVENTGHGSRFAAPICLAIARAYLRAYQNTPSPTVAAP